MQSHLCNLGRLTEYPQHAREVQRIKDILNNMPGAIVLENDNERGKGGYRFPRTFNGVNPEGVEYIADVYAVLPDNRRVIFEIDGKVGHPEFKNLRRDSFFATFGIPTVRYQTGDVFRLKLTEADLMADVEYAFKQMRKALLTPIHNPLAVKAI